jgi:hypothetical protein
MKYLIKMGGELHRHDFDTTLNIQLFQKLKLIEMEKFNHLTWYQSQMS